MVKLAKLGKPAVIFRFVVVALMAVLLTALLTACGSPKPVSIEGTWNAQDASSANSTIAITDKDITLNGGQATSYTKTSSGSENGISYVEIKIEGTTYDIIFPDSNHDIAMMLQPTSKSHLEGKVAYAMNKTSKPSYNDYFSKYMQKEQ